MDLEVIGRHALFFDDDAMAAFVNSSDALVDWNSLSIDRYDVRHLLSSPPPPRSRRRNHSTPLLHPHDSSLDSQLDPERYLDLPPPLSTDEGVSGEQPAIDGGFHAVGFSYGNAEESIDQKSHDAESCFEPPFTVPEELLRNLPPTEKLHQIIARTATFVCKNGGQSEIVLRVKQGDNPTFGFLMPDHHLHPYFRFLVDHQELVRSGSEEKSSPKHAVGALSLLGTVYGSVEDEEGGPEASTVENKSENSKQGSGVPTYKSGDAEHSAMPGGKGESVSVHALSTLKEKASLVKKNRSICSVKSGFSCGHKSSDQDSSVAAVVERKKSSAYPNSFTAEASIMEPPFEMKRQVDKIVEFILKNGMQLESVLAEQDKDHGRFPFLQPSNQYHLYYLKALEDAQQSKLPGKKTDTSIHGAEKTSLREDSDSLSSVSDLPDDLNKKEKFKMVIGRMRKDGQEHPSRESREDIGVSVDAAAAAAILQAARRGIKNPNLEILPRPKSYNGGESLRIGKESTEPLGRPSPPATAMGETAAAASSSEAHSTETGSKKEQKLKAERLKRAKMFAAMLRSGTVPSKAPPPDSSVTCLGVDVDSPREREEGAKPHDSDAVEKTELRLKRSYRSRSKNHDEDDEEEEEEERDEGGEESTERELEHLRKKQHGSHRSSHHSKERHKKHGKKHSSSSKDRDSRHRRHRHEEDTDSSSDDEEYMHKRHSSRRRSHRSSYDDREDEYWYHHSKSRRSHKRERAAEEDSEEEHVLKKAGHCKRHDSQTICIESSVDASSSSLKNSETTEVPDDLRAKIRAMLMATM